MNSSDSTLPDYKAIALQREGRLLRVTLNQPESFNAIDRVLHEELAEVFGFAARDTGSDVIVLTGAGKAFPLAGISSTSKTMQPTLSYLMRKFDWQSALSFQYSILISH